MATPKTRALVRAVADSYDRCLRANPVKIDVDAARRQHEGYVRALEDAGVETIALPRLDDAPDSVFVEDPVVVLDRRAVLTRPGAPSRRAEGDSMLPFLSELELEIMTDPATLDGGDVLRLGQRLFVGLTGRTNEAGVEFLTKAAARDGIETIPVKVQSGLHLKSAVTAVGGAVIGLFDRIDRGSFASRGIETIDAPEGWGANVLDLGNCVLVSAAAPRTAELLASRGLSISIVEMGELHKGDGALTCCSVHLPVRGAG